MNFSRINNWTAIVGNALLVSVMVACFTQCRSNDSEKKIPHSIAPDSTAYYWFKSGTMYNLDVEVFKDSDGDGVGDFDGLISKLPYLDSLGIEVIWLAPFQPTPGRDDGYDVADFYGVDPRLGTIEDFKRFVAAADSLDIRVIIDLVLNHTSDQHPWFKAARDTGSKYHDWYVWSKERPSNYDKGMVFPGVQESIWTYDSVARKYYYHRFYKFQPDLNIQNPDVLVECLKIIKHWVDLGISGFREDAVPFFIEIPQTKGDIFELQFELLSQTRNYLKSLKHDAVILGEANVMPEENADFFGRNNDGLQMMLNFYVNQHMFYALATGEVKPLIDALEQTSEYPKEAQWGQFLRNHDEVDLGRLSDSDRQKVYDAFGPDTSMQLYDRGIRRRFAPMLENDPQHLRFSYSLLFALPSTPIIRYGDEIGMGDDLSLPERLAVRTPMQWSPEKNAGFSTADSTVRPVIDTGEYAYPKLNVRAQQSDSASLLTFMKTLIRLREECPEIAFGDWSVINVDVPNVVALEYQWQGQKLLLLHNFATEERQVNTGEVLKDNKALKDLFTGNIETPETIKLGRYGYKWYRVQ